MRTLSQGEHFGELSLLTPGGKRYLSVRVSSEKPCVLLYLDRNDFQKIVGNISQYLKMNYGGEFDKRFAGTAAARELAQKRGRRTTITQGLVDNTKLKIITGVDATIIEERSGEGSSALGSGRMHPGSIMEINSAGLDSEGQQDEENECDLIDDDECDERHDLPLRHLPESLHLKSQFWT